MVKGKSKIIKNESIAQPSKTSPNINFLTAFNQLVISCLKISNVVLMFAAYILLVFQTIYVLNTKQPKYINLRHVALKWLVCIFLHIIKLGLSSNELTSYFTIILIDILILVVAYPSQTLKAIHLKYFSYKEQKRYTDSISDPNQYDLNFTSKIVISFIVCLLSLSKHLIAFILPQHRRPIQEAVRNINTIIIDQKHFWSIYKKQKQQDQFSSTQKDKATIRNFLISGSSINSNNPFQNVNQTLINLPGQANGFRIPAEANKQFIQAFGEKCSNFTTNGYKPIKKVHIKYFIFESKLEITDVQMKKTESYILQVVSEKQSTVIQFMVSGKQLYKSDPIYIKFQNSKEAEVFMRGIQEAQKIF